MAVDREEMARRLSWIVTLNMLPTEHEEWPERYREMKSWRECFDMKTAGVKELNLAWVDWITGETDGIAFVERLVADE